MNAILISALALAGALALSRFVATERVAAVFAGVEPRLRRLGPWGAALVTVAVAWYVWGEFLPTAKIQDESSYVLQSGIFAKGRWTLPSPSVPEFFEQPHVLVVPALASKYPPGHALLLSFGSLVGFPALMVLVLAGLTGGLVFALAARVVHVWVGTLTWWLWLTAPIVLKFQPSYLSEVTTGALALAAWWWLLDWRETRARRPLLLLALAIGWCAITRPLTALVFALPIGVVVLVDVARTRRWKDLFLPMLAGIAVLAILPLWSARTTGDWRLWPVEQYRLDYMPFDKPGFTADTSAPRRAVSPVIQSLHAYFGTARRQHTVDALPGIATRRALNLTTAWFQNVRLPLLLFAIAGLFAMPRAVAFGLGTAILLFVAHLTYTHDPSWTVYYLEATPVIAALIAIGIWRACRWAAQGETRAPVAAGLALLVLIVAAIPAIGDWRGDHLTRGAFDRRFARALRDVPSPAIVFLRYSPNLRVHPSVVFNHVAPDRAPVWVVHDLGARNAELQRLAPARKAYTVDEEELLRWAVNPAPAPLPLRELRTTQASRPQAP